jgi:hypothetical protein
VAGRSWWLDGSMRAGAKQSQDCRKAMVAEARATEGRRKENGVNPDRPIYRGSTRFAHCGSFRRTTRPNGSIPRSLREDCDRFIVNRIKSRPEPGV